MFGVSALFGSYIILSNSPDEDPEHTEPIDVIHSKIAAEDRMSSSLLDWNCLFFDKFLSSNARIKEVIWISLARMNMYSS